VVIAGLSNYGCLVFVIFLRHFFLFLLPLLMALWHLSEQVAAVRPVPFSGKAVVFEL